MMAIGIVFSTHAVLVSVALTQSSRSTSLETDVLLADMSSYPLSIGSAGDLARKVDFKADMEVLTVTLTDALTEVHAKNSNGDPMKALEDIDEKDAPSTEKGGYA